MQVGTPKFQSYVLVEVLRIENNFSLYST